MANFLRTIDSVSSDINSLISEAEPALLLVERLEFLVHELAALSEAASRSSRLLRAAVYVTCLTVCSYFYQNIVGVPLSIALLPLHPLRRQAAKQIFSDCIFYLRTGEVIRAILFLSVPFSSVREWVLVALLLPVLLTPLAASLALRTAIPAETFADKSSERPTQDSKRLRPCTPRIYRRGEFQRAQRAMLEENERKQRMRSPERRRSVGPN